MNLSRALQSPNGPNPSTAHRKPLRIRVTQTFAAILLFALLAGIRPAGAQTAGAEKPTAATADSSQNPGWFFRFYRPFVSQRLPKPELRNSARLSQMTRDGKIELSLAELLAAVVENNLDIGMARYSTAMAETDILRARSGQAPRGVDGVPIPSGLFAGAIGAGVGGGGGRGGGGGGGGGGISGSGRLVSIGPRGSYDPSLNLNFSVDTETSPLNTLRVSGVAAPTSHSTSLQFFYAQAFTSGTSFSLSLNSERESSTQQSLLFNPGFASRLNFSVNQQLLNGFGFAVTRRFLKVAENNRKTAREVFRQQAVLAVSNAQNLYWDLAAARERVRAAEQALAVAQRLYEDNRKQAEIGTLAPLDVVGAEAEVAARRRDLIAAQTDQQFKEVQLKNVMSKEMDLALGAAPLETTDPLPEPQDSDVPPFEEALATAMKNRPELARAEGGILNQEVVTQFTKKQLQPSLSIFGQLASASRAAVLSAALGQVRRFDFPEYSVGFALTIPIANRSAQADDLRARLELRQAETALQRTRNQIRLEVQNAIVALLQARAQIAAASKATDRSKQTLDAEEKKLQAGVSTPYNVIRVQRDLQTAQFAEVEARVTYAKARVALEQAMGVTLEKNHIALDDVIQGQLFASNLPTPAR
ncbi:MAG: hypothetical protein A3J28_17300 [Acidobacteria bacterium RIFCSPLOWO2_12_FULL_60_22]|nr:MAG: hypothetical protein A3J28_17300 [Acidobacteria bacterium RIFCSPLOWO2_12_FULL_60_22]